MDRRIAGIAAAAAFPLLAVVATLAFIAAEATGVAVGTHGALRNIAEAAGVGNSAEVVRMLGEAQDPTRVMPMRATIISSSVRQASALEAAVWGRQLGLIKLFDARGMIIGDERRRLACLAEDLRAEDIAGYLAGEVPPACVRGQVLDAIQARLPEPETVR
jgi:hypothetical protein